MFRFIKSALAVYGLCVMAMALAGFVGIGEFRMFYGSTATLAAKVAQACNVSYQGTNN